MKMAPLLLILFSPLLIIGQHTGEENYIKVKLIFHECSKDTIFFKKTSSNKFISEKNEYQLNFKTAAVNDNEDIDITENTWFSNNYIFTVKYLSSLDLVPQNNIPDKKWNLKIKLRKKKQEMTVILKLYEDLDIVLAVPFKKGNYEVTDSKKPVLIKIKN